MVDYWIGNNLLVSNDLNWTWTPTTTTAETTTPFNNNYYSFGTYTVEFTVTDQTYWNELSTTLGQQATNYKKILSQPLTAEEIKARKKREAIAKAKRTRAKNKARVLLLMHLDIVQTQDFEKFGYFFVEGSEGSLYKIKTGRSGNVKCVNPLTLKTMWSLCAHPIEAVPDFDTMLAQKLWLETDEAAFVEIANISTPYEDDDELPEVQLEAIANEYEHQLYLALAA